MEDRIAHAKDLLATSRHASMATVNEDSSPHNTPYFFMYNPELTKLFWSSHPETAHVKNIMRTGQLFVTLFHHTSPHGLYLRADNGRLARAEEFGEAVAAINAAAEKAGYNQYTAAEYAANQSKLYVADIKEMWVNGYEQDEKGMVTRDFRVPVIAQDLID